MMEMSLRQFEYPKVMLASLVVFVTGLLVSARTVEFVPTNSGASGSQRQTNAQEVKPTEVRELKEGAPIERELTAGETHSYRVTLTAGQYLHVVVEQKGIDVVVRLFGPDGKKITEVDSPNGTEGPEPVMVVAETAGDYRLEVKSLEEKVAPGRYEVKVEELRAATARDADRIAAEKTLAEAEQLRAQGTAKSLRQAIENYNQALSFLRTVSDRQREALTMNAIGSVYWQLGESQKALDYYGQSLPLLESLGDRRGKALVLHNIGTAYWQLGDSQKALEYYIQALPLKRELGDRREEAITLGAIGLAYDHLGRLNEALDYHNRSLALRREVGDRREEANTLSNIGITYYNLGEPQKSLDYYNRALLMRREIGDRRGEAITLGNIGVTYWNLGDLQKALEYQNQALPLQRAMGNRVGEFTTLGNIGIVHLSANEPEKALEYYNQALQIARAIGDRRGEAGMLHQLGVVYRSLREPQKALDFLNQALTLRRAAADPLGEALTIGQIGLSYSLMGKPDDALSYLQTALWLHRALGARGSEVWTLEHIANVERDRGHLKEARAQIESALNMVESTRSKLISQEDRTSFSASRQDLYEFYIDLLMQMHQQQPSAGHDVSALAANERARARGLLEILAESRADIRRGIDPVLLERERSLQQQLNVRSEHLTRLLGSKHTEEQETAAKKEVDALLTDYKDVQAEIRAKSPRYAALTQPQPLSSKGIQELLDKDTLLLEYALGNERSHLWAVTPTSIKSFELPKRAEVETTARQFYELVTSRKNREIDAQAEAAATLSRMLLGPVAGQLGQKRLVIVSDGPLHYIPFAALPEPAAGGQSGVSRKTGKYQPLVINHEVVSLPSASVLAVVRRELENRLPSPKTVAVLADPVFQSGDPRIKPGLADSKKIRGEALTRSGSSGDPKSEFASSVWESGGESFQRLQHSREEAEAIVAQARAKDALLALDFSANRATVVSGQLAQYRIVHFATHGLVNNVHPELSGIVLSLVDEMGQPQNGFVRLNEVYNLNLPADLVVLSGCRTALGKEVRGEGLIGLTRGFMYAGAPRVVVSLWPVSDKGTAELMKRFYQGMLGKGLPPAAALRAAQKAMWKTNWWDAPYYWAGFVLQGEWR